jgi:hypothetical protein
MKFSFFENQFFKVFNSKFLDNRNYYCFKKKSDVLFNVLVYSYDCPANTLYTFKKT